MSHGGNFEVAPPDLLDPNFKGNYPDGPPPIPPPPIPPTPPTIPQPLFKRGSDGNYDVSWATYWTKPLLREAMAYWELILSKHPNNTDSLKCVAYYEVDVIDNDPGIVAQCIPRTVIYNTGWINTTEYQLKINISRQNSYTQDEWVGILIHELCHALGFLTLSAQPEWAATQSNPPLKETALRPELFPQANNKYKELVFSNGTFVPLANLGHILGEGFNIEGNPGYPSFMNATTQTAELLMDPVVVGTLESYGYVVKNYTAPRTAPTYSIPSSFKCGNH